jgi:hypothetical protein
LAYVRVFGDRRLVVKDELALEAVVIGSQAGCGNHAGQEKRPPFGKRLSRCPSLAWGARGVGATGFSE